MLAWPRACAYWQEPRISSFLHGMGFVYADFDGCMYGLRLMDTAHADKFIHKPWLIACMKSSLPSFPNRKCNRRHRHHPCEGRDT
eukprot:15462342-Alexandrium_andersonii.AAC.1